MKLKLIMKIFLILLICFPITSLLEAKKLEFNIDLGLQLLKNSSETSYLWNWETHFMDVTEEAFITNKPKDLIMNLSAGLRWMIKENFGLYFSISLLNNHMNSISDYTLDFTWYDGENELIQNEWQERNGKVFTTPYTIGLVLRKHISGSSSLVLKGGVSIATANTNIKGVAGFAEAFETETEYRINWYALNVEINQSDTIIGGNIGFEYEKRIARSFDFYAGLEYFYFPSKTYKWEVKTKEFYDSIGEQTILIDPQILHEVDGDITTDINFSNMRIYSGFRYYF